MPVSLDISPAHIPKGTVWVFKYIISGNGLPSRAGNLVDTDIIDGLTRQNLFAEAMERTIFIVGPFGISFTINPREQAGSPRQ